MTFNLLKFLTNIRKNTRIRDEIISNFNIYSIGFIGSIGHPFYWFWWTYIDPRSWEIPIIRIIGFLSCFSLLLLFAWPQNFKKYAKKYWLLVLTYNLSFFFTFYLIVSRAHLIWNSAFFVMVFIGIMLIARIYIWFIHFIIGILSAIILALILNIDLSFLNYELLVLDILPILIFAIFTAFIFSYSNAHGIANEIERREKLNISTQRQQALQALGGSIAHEMRNTLGSIHNSVYLTLEKLKQIFTFTEAKSEKIKIEKKDLEEISELVNLIDYSLVRGNMVIDIILSNIYDKQPDKTKFKILRISDIVKTVIREFAFSSKEEKEKVSANIKNDFYFKGDENMMVFVLFNLLKNALYYLETCPNSRIVISTREDDLNSKFNYLYFKDTGVGISEDKLVTIFEPFMTSGKIGGTGLGLPFCKRVMTSLDGMISCNSKLGEYTEFVLSFPKVDENVKDQELLIAKNKNLQAEQIIQEIYNNKTVLLVDDQIVSRKLNARRLEKLGFKVIIANHGRDALEILCNKGDEIDMILLDIQMPEIDGYEVVNLIKEGYLNQKGEPFINFKNYANAFIIAFSGNNDTKTLQKIKDHGIKWCLGKSWDNDELVEIIQKHLNIK